MINFLYNKYFLYKHYDSEYTQNYNKVFSNYKNYQTKCICGQKNDDDILEFDRSNNKFPITLCKKCGLIRAKRYFKRDDILNIYSNIYNSERRENTSDELYKSLSKSKDTFESWFIIEQYANLSSFKKLKIIDIGGGGGGFLDKYKNVHECYVSDFETKWLDTAKKNNINIITGGIDQIIKQKNTYDLIIMNHVVEHWNEFSYEINNLKKICKINKTKIFIEVPGVDSLKRGRREGDIKGDVIFYHYHYFTSYTLKQLMSKYGFHCLYSDDKARLIFELSNVENPPQFHKNFYLDVKKDINRGSNKKIYFIFKNYIVNILIKFINVVRLKKIVLKTFKIFLIKQQFIFIYNILTYINYYYNYKKYKKIVHFHVPQCGGNSINYFLKLNFGFRLYQFRKNSVLNFENYISRNEYIITAHSGIDFVNKFLDNKNFYYILSIRHPQNRFLSNYYRNKKLFELENKNKKFISLNEFLKSRLDQKLDNIFIRYLSNIYNYDGYSDNKLVDQNDYNIAIKNLQFIDFINIIDQKDCFDRLHKELKIKIPYSKFFSLHKNKVSDSKYPIINLADQKLLNKLTFYDLKLYNKITKNNL